ncbi:MAG: NADH-quinone oxidoreductase subunit N [Burkholderiales bacterium]|nr:NADH-quinone oxidoreductase subunit N [Burkholderiales bacterium]
MNAVLIAMLPEHLLLAGMVGLILMAIVGAKPRYALPWALLAVGAAAVSAALLAAAGTTLAPFAGHYSVAPPWLVAKALVLALALPVLLMSRHDFDGVEFPLLLLSSLYGVALMLSSDSFLTLFLGLEIMSLPVYVLVLLAYRRPQSAEAALKYLVLGGAASATFLMGVSLLYGTSGSMAISMFGLALSADSPLLRAAIVLILLAFFLKASVVPFHAWAPDAYEGASVPVTAYMAVIVKSGVLLAVVRLFGIGRLATPMTELVAVLPLASIVWGNLAAMKQPSLRRMIAYSGIAHAGYLFYALLGDPAGRLQSVTFYLVAYGLLNLLAFAALPAAADDGERDRLDNLRGLFHREPYAALMIGAAMLSLAGIPPFPGFVAKFLIFRNVMAAGYTTYAVLGLVGSYLGIYFYLRVIQLMFMSPDAKVAPTPQGGALARGASAACFAATVLLAVFPGWLLARL